MTKHDKKFRNTELNTFVEKDRAEMENTTEVNTEIKMQKKNKKKTKTFKKWIHK